MACSGEALSCFLGLSHSSAVAEKRIWPSLAIAEERSICSPCPELIVLTNSHDSRHPQSNNAGYTIPKEVQTGEDNHQLQNTR